MKLIEDRLSKTKFLCSDQISIADLSAACELEQMRFIGIDLSKWPKTEDWLYRVIDENPPVLAIHEPIRKFAAMSVAKQFSKQGKPTPKL